MQKHLYFYLLAFTLLVFSLLFFFKAYNELQTYVELSSKANKVHNSFTNLSRHLNNAATITSSFIKATHKEEQQFFYTDSTLIINELEILQSTVTDSINVKIAAKLNGLLRSEMSWLLRSNVPDSLMNHKAWPHIAKLQLMSGLTEKGIQRTNFLVVYRKDKLMSFLKRDGYAMLCFILMSIAIIIYTTHNLFHQQEKLKHKDDQLVKKEYQFSKTLDNMMEGVQILDFEWKYIYVNDALIKHSTYSLNELIGFNFMERYPGVEKSHLHSVMKRCMEERIEEHLENEFEYPNGTKAFFELSIRPVPEGIFILSIDITERKKMETKLLKVNRLYAFISAINQNIVHTNTVEALLYNACNIAVNIGEFKTAWIGWLNDKQNIDVIELCGEHPTTGGSKKHQDLDYTQDFLIHTPTGRALSTGDYAVSNDVENDPSMSPWKEEYMEKEVRSSSSIPIRKFGKVVGIFSFSSSIKDFFDTEEVSLLQEAVSDISFALEIMENAKKHEATEKRIEANERRFRALIENSVDMKTLATREGKFFYCSPAVTEILGYEEEDFLHKPAIEFFHPDERLDLFRRRTALLEFPGKSLSFKNRFMHKDGHWIWCEGTLKNMLHEPSINAIVANFRDISEQKIIEQQGEKMSNDILQRNKHLEQFAYIISHNLRSPVANIMGIGNLLKGSTLPEEQDKMLNYLFVAIEKLDTVVLDLNKILELQTGLSAQREAVVFSDLVEDIKTGLQDYTKNDNVEFITNFSEVNQLTSVKSYLHSIFYNLISNSIKYRRPGLPVLIKITSTLINDKVRISFKDNGIGLDLKLYGEKVFKLYQRFQRQIEGKGMGLFMVKSQVESLGGTIQLFSEPGFGAEFIVEFPVEE